GLGLRLVTPPGFMNAVSEGADPSASDRTTVDRQISSGQIRLWVYNSQNATPDVKRLTDEARSAGIAVVTVSETPEPASASFQDWQVRLGRGPVWSDVSLTLREGEFAAVLGANGAGKTTLLRAILGLLPLAAGSVTVLGRPPGAANGSIGYLPQRRSFDESSRIRGIDVVRLGFDGDRWGVPLPVPVGRTGRLRRAQARERVAEAIELVGAGAYAHR